MSTPLDPWINSADESGGRNSMQWFAGDGAKTSFEFNFAGGYIDAADIKAYIYDDATGVKTDVTPDLTGPNTINYTPALPAGKYLVAYRDTQKTVPLVDFASGAVLNEPNLDMIAKQAVFNAAEMVDRFSEITTSSNDAIARSFTALQVAQAASDKSDGATSTANTARETADAATAVSAAATTTANNALDVANGIDAKATSALDNSNAAVDTANSAATDAGNALAVANGIDAKASSALDASAAAQTAAEDAAASVAGLAPQTGPLDTTPGAAMAVGAFGLGTGDSAQPTYPLADLNADPTSVPSGLYRVTTTISNRPGNQSSGSQIIVQHYATGVVSVLLQDRDGRLYTRFWNAAWGAWVAAATAASVDSQLSAIPLRSTTVDDLKWLCHGVGHKIYIPDHMAGVDIPPTNDSRFRYVKLSAGDSYNSGVFGSETVSGSDPKVSATAVISFAGSPLDGQTIRLINTERRILRAGNSGVTEEDQLGSHAHTASQAAHGHTATQVAHSHTIYTKADNASANTEHISYPENSAAGAANHTIANSGTNSVAPTISVGAAQPAITVAAAGGNETRPRTEGISVYMRIM